MGRFDIATNRTPVPEPDPPKRPVGNPPPLGKPGNVDLELVRRVNGNVISAVPLNITDVSVTAHSGVGGPGFMVSMRFPLTPDQASDLFDSDQLILRNPRPYTQEREMRTARARALSDLDDQAIDQILDNL